ncbi:AraC family transcriptional regulator [Streptomyces sp. NPDC051940]|uniref:AraC family transcriptional regulator n=1 Tax=Streptomyces sp. NPDC051940 TaxID=3155675 RepID=UPI0034467C68
MDVLADALSALRTGAPRSAGADLHAPWGLRFPAIAGATFHVVLQGNCWLSPTKTGPLRLGAGDVVLLRHGNAHVLRDDLGSALSDFAPVQGDAPGLIGRVRVEGPGARTVLLCGAYPFGGTRHPLLGELPAVVHLPTRSRTGALRDLVGLIGEELGEPQPGRDGILPALIDAMLLYILRAWVSEQAHTAAGGWAAALTDPAIGRALAAIHAEPAHPWTVAELGARSGLGRSAFAQRFSALVGAPPAAYLTWWRMTVAARLLHASDAPLGVIAQRVGYTSEFAFGKAFKREHGRSPGRYRSER